MQTAVQQPQSGNLAIYNQVRSVPEDAKSPISGGPMKGKTNVNPMWRIQKLTELFGPCGEGWKVERSPAGPSPPDREKSRSSAK